MNKARYFLPSISALLLLGCGALSHVATGRQDALKEQIVGTWKYVSVDNVRPDGTRVPLFGPEPQGRVAFDRHGNYVLITSRAGQPNFASGDRNRGTDAEYKAVVQGSIAHFGRYEVSEADKTIIFHIETSTFPNWNGIDQKRPFSITGDELKWVTPSASSGCSAEVRLKRAP
jgi:hypothetical protein